MENELQKIIYSKWDLQQSLSSLTFLLQEYDIENMNNYSNEDLRKFKSYETASIISFSRPFIPTRNGKCINLKDLKVNLTKNENFLKHKIINLRNKIVAHSDEDYMDFQLINRKLSSSGSYFLLEKYNENLLLDNNELCKFEILIHSIMTKIEEYLFDISQKDPEILNYFKDRKNEKRIN